MFRYALSLAMFLCLVLPSAQAVAQTKQEDPAFAPVVENPALPRVLLLGDSISVGYTLEVRRLLAGKANVLRASENCGPTSKGVANIDSWLGSGKWDVIHFNFGLHDIKHMIGDKTDIAGEWQVSAEQYKKNVKALVRKLKATGARLVWASTTPVPEGAGGRIAGEELKVNEIALKVMKKYDVPVNDLHAHVLPKLATYQQPQNVHFIPEGYAFLAQKVAEDITKALGANVR